MRNTLLCNYNMSHKTMAVLCNLHMDTVARKSICMYGYHGYECSKYNYMA